MGSNGIYPLEIIQKTMEHHHFLAGQINYLIAMLNHQRDYNITIYNYIELQYSFRSCNILIFYDHNSITIQIVITILVVRTL